MTDTVTEYMVVSLTSAAVGSFLTLLTCWAAGMFDSRSETADIDAYTRGMQDAIGLQQESFEAAQFTEHSAQVG